MVKELSAEELQAIQAENAAFDAEWKAERQIWDQWVTSIPDRLAPLGFEVFDTGRYGHYKTQWYIGLRNENCPSQIIVLTSGQRAMSRAFNTDLAFLAQVNQVMFTGQPERSGLFTWWFSEEEYRKFSCYDVARDGSYLWDAHVCESHEYDKKRGISYFGKLGHRWDDQPKPKKPKKPPLFKVYNSAKLGIWNQQFMTPPVGVETSLFESCKWMLNNHGTLLPDSTFDQWFERRLEELGRWHPEIVEHIQADPDYERQHRALWDTVIGAAINSAA